MGATGLFLRKIEKSKGIVCRLTKRHKKNRAKSGLKRKPHHEAPDGLIYGLQEKYFDNHVDPKKWQHGPNYTKHSLRGALSSMNGYVKMRSGSFTHVKNDIKRVQNWKASRKAIKRQKVLSLKAAA